MPIALATALALAISTPPASTLAALEKAGAPVAATIRLAYKLDPRLAGPTYGGERWVSPLTYQGANGQDTVDVQAAAVDAKGTRLKTAIEWSPSDPKMVTVTPSRGEQVKIAVKQPGQSTLTLKAGGTSKKLTVKASQLNGLWLITISQ